MTPPLQTEPTTDTNTTTGGGLITPVLPPEEIEPDEVGETVADVTVVRLDKNGTPPVGGALVQVYAVQVPEPVPLTFPPTPVPPVPDPLLVDQGYTDGNGGYLFSMTTQVVPIPDLYRIVVSGGKSGISFSPASVDVFYNSQTEPLLSICPAGASALLCEIADKQLRTTQVFNALNSQWSGPNAFTLDQAHAYMMNLIPSAAELTQPPLSWIQDVSWGLMDFAIPLEDWPEALRGKAQAMRIFNEIPFPEIGGKDWFLRCARALPIYEGKRGEGLSVNNWRLYSKKFSNYMPRSDNQIRRDLAARYLLNLPTIFDCIEHKIQRKADEVGRSAKFYGFMSVVASFLLAPLTGGVSLVKVAADVGTEIATDYEVEVNTKDIFAGLAAFGLVLGGTPGAREDLIAALTNLVLALLGEDFDPTVKKIIVTAIPEAVDVAIEELGIGTAGGDALQVGAQDVISLQSVATGVLSFAVATFTKAIKAKGLTRVKDFYDSVLDLKNVPAKMLPFILWCISALLLDDVIEEAAKEAGAETTGDPQTDALDPIREEIEAQGETVPDVVQNPKVLQQRKIQDSDLGVGGGLAILGTALALS